MVKLEEIKSLGSIRGQIKKITAKDLSVKDVELRGSNWLKSGMKLKKNKI